MVVQYNRKRKTLLTWDEKQDDADCGVVEASEWLFNAQHTVGSLVDSVRLRPIVCAPDFLVVTPVPFELLAVEKNW